MKTQLIQKKDWEAFFDSFSRRHEGWLTVLEVFRSDIGAQTEERALALKGITAELEGDGEIEIMIGARPGGHITHSIAAPTEITLEQTDEGADAALAIKSQDGATTLLRLCSPVLPEVVDGIIFDGERRPINDPR